MQLTSLVRACLFGILPASSALAATFTVNTLVDEFNTPSGTSLSLREAVRDAALPANSAADRIVFAPGLSGGTVALNDVIDVDDPDGLTIDATGLAGGLTVDGALSANDYGLFYINLDVSLVLRGLTLAHGTSFHGGAIWVNGGDLTLVHCTLFGNVATQTGGAIYSRGGNLTLTQCTLFDNSAAGGGAIRSAFGSLTMSSCTLTANSALYGGATVISAGSAQINHCTFALNHATGDTWGDGGGALDCYDSPAVTVNACILAGNTAVTGIGPELWKQDGTLIARQCLIGNGTSSTVTGGANGNIVGNGAAPRNALLAPLGAYGGTTRTKALLPGSPARNAAPASTATTDQRGFPIIGTADIGAYEAGTFSSYEAWIWEVLPITEVAPHAPAADFDGDGASNNAEWLALTDPGNAGSIFRITSVTPSAGNLVFTFPSSTGRNYTLFRSDSLTGTWANTGLPAIAGNGDIRTFTVASPSTGVPKRFFRVHAAP